MATRIVISGCTSFIGLALLNIINNSTDYEVIALVRPNSSRLNLLNQYNINIVECNLENILDVYRQGLIRDAGIFFHIGWSSDFEDSRYNLQGQMRNVDYLLNAITLANKLGCKTFVGIGSQAECGVINSPITENTENNPLTAYAEAKCLAYEKGIQLAESYGMKFCWPRLLSAYGSNDRSHTLISSCISSGLLKKTIQLTRCEQIWDFVNVNDVARALLLIALKGEHGIKYPIASGHGRILREYIEVIARETNYPQLLEGIGKKPYIDGQPMYLVGNIKKLTEDTGFIPKVEFETGIQELVRL